MSPISPIVESLDGPALFRLLQAAGHWLEANAPAIDAINVFPVPDGDTGTNMSLTMRAAVSAGEGAADGAGAVARVMARGALMGARGNSGVILSQILRGLADGLEGIDRATPADLAGAFRRARDAAYASVPQPVEGTILTVIDAVAKSVERQAASGDGTCEGLMAAAVEAARDAVERTPSLLPILAEAGVVDAGGQGLLTILEGCRRHLTGEEPPVRAAAAPDRAQLAAAALHEEEGFFGYCTEILVAGRNLSRDEALRCVGALGRSLLVVGDETLLRIHVHTEDPGAVLSYGASLGTLLSVKVENMEEQYRGWTAAAAGEPAWAPAVTGWTVVAVAPGDGMAEVLRSLGAAFVVFGGQTANPSAEEILEGTRAAAGEGAFVLPNNKNIILAAEQAAGMADRPVRVIPTRSFPQGVAAMLAFSAEADPDQNALAMAEAARGVRSIEVTRAVRSVTIGGVDVKSGQFMVIIDGELAAAEDTAEESVLAGLDRVVTIEHSVVTLYWGADADHRLARDLAERIRGGFGVDVEVVRGGQQLYPYVLSVE